MDDQLLERRRSCLLSLSHKNVSLDAKAYEFCEVFSETSEDIADAADFFLQTLSRIQEE